MNYLEKIKPRYSGYQELHVHTEASYKDATTSVEEVFDAAEELGRKAVAITDHGNWVKLFSALKERTKREKKALEKELISVSAPDCDIKAILKAMGDFGSIRNPDEKMLQYIEKYESAFIEAVNKTVQFIPGIEMYEESINPDEAKSIHLILYPKSWEGIKSLFALTTLAETNKVKDMPRCTLETLRKFVGPNSAGHGKVIGTSACIGGQIPNLLLIPYRISTEIKELELAIEKATIIPESALERGRKIIEKTDANIKKITAELKEKTKEANKKYASLITRAEKALVKAEKKFEKNTDETPVKDAKSRLKSLILQQQAAEVLKNELPLLKDEILALKGTLKASKENLASLEKQNAPAHKIMIKIEALKQKQANLGNIYEQAKSLAQEYKDIFGEGNFYIELQDHGLMEEFIIKEQLIDIAKDLNIPLTVANDVHYKYLDSKRKRDFIASMRFNTPLEDVASNRGSDQLWFKPDEVMASIFKDVPEALENTSRIAEQCNVYYKKEIHLPQFVDTEGGKTPSEYLRNLCRINFPIKYPDYKSWSKEKQKTHFDRISFELDVIEKMGYSSYISIVEDFMSFSRKNFSNESVGPGRGSGAGSIVCYLVGITDIDPLRYGLLFERFLNPERISMPDIDTDYATSIREKVVDYATVRYAYKGDYIDDNIKISVSNISTEGKLKAKGAVRAVGRVTGVSLSLCDQIAKLIPGTPGTTLSESLATIEQLKTVYETNPMVKSLIDDALLVEGTPTQCSVHAAGIIIADKPITEYAPMFWNEKKSCWAIQYDMISCESDVGLLKMDFLGLKNLDVIMRAKSFVKKTSGIDLDFSKIKEADDEKVITSIFATGKTNGIFQFESGGMKQVLQSFAPKTIDDVILLNAAYRPGPMQHIPLITDVKFGRKKAEYILPEMESILGSTYGSPIYQEQIQQIFHNIAGFSLGQADIIRRAMSKKHLNEIEDAKDKFVEGFKSKGADPERIEEFWTGLLEFAKYAFNKSHAAAYSIIAYYTAFLKYYHPAEFLASLMSYADIEKMPAYAKEARIGQIEVLRPCINKSVVFTAPTRDNKIRLGLEKLKDVGSAGKKIVAERKERGPYKSYEEFILRCLMVGVNKSAIEALIKAGAVDDIIKSRLEAFVNVATDTTICKAIYEEEAKVNPEASISELYKLTLPKLTLKSAQSTDEYNFADLIRFEKDVSGIYLSGSPLDEYKAIIDKCKATDIADLAEGDCYVAGYVAEFTELKRKRDGKAMCKIILEDYTDSIPAMCFVFNYAKFGSQFSQGAVVEIRGKYDTETDDDNNVTSRQIIITSAKRLA